MSAIHRLRNHPAAKSNKYLASFIFKKRGSECLVINLLRSCLLMLVALWAVPAVEAQAYKWKNVPIHGGGFVSGLEFHPTEPGLLYARTDVGGAFRYDTANQRWIPLNDATVGTDNAFMELGVASLALDPQDPNRLYLACGQYLDSWAPAATLMRSTDRGATWARTTLAFKLNGNSNGRNTGERLVVDPNLGSVLLIGTPNAGLWRSTNYGASFTQLTGFPAGHVTWVLFDRRSGNAGSPSQTIYAGVAVTTSGSPSVFRSTDAGTTWSALPGQPTALVLASDDTGSTQPIPQHGALAYDATGGLLITYGNALGPSGLSSGAVWRYDTSSGAWTNITPTPAPPAQHGGFGGISVSAQNPAVLAVSTLNRWWPAPGDEIYRSTDGGATWASRLHSGTRDDSSAPWVAPINPHWIGDVEIDPTNSDRVLFVTGFGLYQTNDFAATAPTWAFLAAGLEETVPANLISPSSGPTLVSVIGDYDGFRHDDVTGPTPSTRHSPTHGSNRSLAAASLAPAIMARTFEGDPGAPRGGYSTDGAATWVDFAASPSTTTKAGAIAVNADGTRFVWNQIDLVPHVSTNSGASWTPATGSVPAGSHTPVADPVAPLRFYIYDSKTGILHRSTDGGVSFSAAASGLPTGANAPIAAPDREGDLWMAAWGNGLRRSTDGGASFTTISSVQSAYRIGFGRAADGATYPALYIWGRVGGLDAIWRSIDTGSTWQRINDDAHNYGFINCLTGDPRRFGRVYLGTGGRGIIFGDPADASPTDLTADPANAAVLLSWSGTAGADSYIVKRGTTSGGPYTTIASGVTETSYLDAGLVNDTTYYYVVAATNASATSPDSTEASATPSGQWTGAIIGSSGSWGSLGNTTANVFDGNTSTYYDAVNGTGDWAGLDLGEGAAAIVTQVKYCPRPGWASRMVGGQFQGSNVADFSTGVTTLFTITSAPAEGTMTVQTVTSASSFRYLRYIGPANAFCNVAEVEFDGPAPVPSVPTNLVAASGNASAVLSWTGSADADSYVVKRITTSGSGYATIASGVTATSFTDTGLTNGTTYYYVVAATNVYGASPDSSEVSATAAALTVNTVGVINPNNVAVLGATGNAFTATTFASNIASAYTNNTGGVWNFETAFSVAAGETITLKYGASLTNSVTLTLTGAGINRDGSGDTRPSGSFQMGLAGGAATRTFTPSKPLLSIGIFNTDRNDASRTPVLTVTYQNNTTATTSGANADNVFFHGLSGTAANPIVSFALSQNNFVRYDDLAFIVAPPPAPTALTAAPGSGQVTLSWSAVSGATGYTVKRATTSGGSYTTVASGLTSTSYTNTGLTNGTTYYYVVSAVNADGESANSAQAAATPQPPAPAAPTGLTVTSSGTQTSLSWSAASGATSYTVKRATSSGGPYTTIASGVTATTYTDTGLVAGTTYYYVITATNGGGESAASAQSSSTLVALAPTGLTVIGWNGAVDLRWNTSSGATGYNVKRATTSGGAYTTVASSVTATSYSDTSVTNGTTYYYVVSAVNAGGQSANSSEVSTIFTQPVVYLKFNETSGTSAADSSGNGWTGTLVNGPLWSVGRSNNTVDLDGTDDHVTLPTGVVNGLTNFTITLWANLDTAPAWSRLFDFGTGTNVNMFLTPKNGANNNIRYAITTGGGSAEQRIDGTSALPIGGWHHVAVTLSGTTGTLYVDGVQVGQNTAMTLTPSSLGSTTQNRIGRSQYSDPYPMGRIDEFRVYSRALSAAEIVSLMNTSPAGLVSAPASLTATAGTAQAALNWSSVTGATSYDVMRTTTNGGLFAPVATGLTTTSYTNTGLTAGTTYYYVVIARNSTGESVNSPQATATAQ